MSLLKSLCSAFLMYSRIPFPKVQWKEENRRFSLCFFPLIGAVIGICLLLWYRICEMLEVGNLFFSVGCTVIPIAVTGGIHLDGFCDVNDALASCAPREKMLEIMKDPNTGAFALIRLSVYLLIQTAVFTELRNFNLLLICSLCFIQSRAWSGLAAVTWKSAKLFGTCAQNDNNHYRNNLADILCTDNDYYLSHCRNCDDRLWSDSVHILLLFLKAKIRWHNRRSCRLVFAGCRTFSINGGCNSKSY